MTRPRKPDDLLTPAEAAGELRKTERQMRRWRDKGGGPEFIKLPSGVVYYRWGAIQAWISRCTVLPKAPPPPPSASRRA